MIREAPTPGLHARSYMGLGVTWQVPMPGLQARSYMGLGVRNMGIGARKNWVNGAWVGARENWGNGARDGAIRRTDGGEHTVCVVFPYAGHTDNSITLVCLAFGACT